jgi:tetratricopeptide (TPR) repeat protein
MKKYIIPILLLMALPLAAADEEKDDRFKKATKYFFQKKFEMAELYLKEEIRENPENGLAYSYLGDVYLHKKQFERATGLYQKAVDLEPDRAENYFRLGQAYYHRGMAAPAIENFRRAITRDSGLSQAWYHIGLTELMLNRDKQSTIENWERFLQAAPEDPQYESIRRVVELLRDPDFVIPPKGSDVSIEEALLLGGETLKNVERKPADRQEGHEKLKGGEKIEGLLGDEDL